MITKRDLENGTTGVGTAVSTGTVSPRPSEATDGGVPVAKAREESMPQNPTSVPDSVVSPGDVDDPALHPATIRTRTEELQQQLQLEVEPQTAVEQIIVADMARHAAAMKYAAGAEPAVLGACVTIFQPSTPANLPGISLVSDELKGQQASLAMAFAGSAVEGVSRYSARHTKGFYRALVALERIRQRSAIRAADADQSEQFHIESACIAYLLGRRQLQGWRCPRCGHVRGYWLSKRQRYECGNCGQQSSLRAGTVMERSRLSLVQWFRAILSVAANLRITPTELGQVIGITRVATVRHMLDRIRTAMESPAADQLLAGLQRL